MKKIFGALALLIAMTSCQEQQKIGFIDNGEVINNYQMKMDIEDKYKAKDDEFKKRMDSLSRNFQIEAQAFQLAANKMSTKKQQEKYTELSQKQQVLQQQFQIEQQEMQQAFSVEMDSVISKVNDFVKDYGKTNGFSFILGKNEAGSVLYGEDNSDLTQTITDALNADYKPEAKTETTKKEDGK